MPEVGEKLRASLRLQARGRQLLSDHAHQVPPAVSLKAENALNEHVDFIDKILEGTAVLYTDVAAERKAAGKVSQVLAALGRREAYTQQAFNRMGGAAAAKRARALATDPSRAKLRATASALAASTGVVAATDATWGALYRIVDALFEGQVPLEAVGTSAKFYASGEVHRARYHVALQPPCDCWALARADVIRSAREAARVLKAPALVGAWINVLEATSSNESLPALGFGVSVDDRACKMYVMNAKGQTLPALPLLLEPSSVSVDAVLPKLGKL
jgi:hypothetical protein